MLTPILFWMRFPGTPAGPADFPERVLVCSSLAMACALGYLAWRRRDAAVKGPALALALSFATFFLLHLVQALALGPWIPAARTAAALASLVTAALVLWLMPRFLASPTPEQVRAQGEERIQALTEDLVAKDQAHAVELLESEALLQSKKLESLGILAGGLAHDFNNLLGAMAGNVELARLEKNRQGLEPYLDTLGALVRRSAALVQQILAYSGRGKAQIITIDLNQRVEETTRLMRAALAHKATVQTELDPQRPVLRGDLTQIQQVILNLVLNAAEAASSEQATITLRTGLVQLTRADLDQQFHGQNLEPGPHVFLEVADNGPGLTPEVMERIFDPFFTTRFLGRGLGLAAIRGIVLGHGGGILVRSEPNHGASFKLFFPAAEAGTGPVEAPPFEEALGSYQGTGTVLVADDEDPLRAMAVKALEIMGFQTLQARDGLEALQVFQAHQSRIRLVLMDLTMPRMGGEEAYRVLRRTGALVPVILSSGFTEMDVLMHFRGRGIAGFLQKPYRLETLMAKVRKALENPDGNPKPQRPPLRWAREMETGNAILDFQHRELTASYNRLVESTRQQGPTREQSLAFTLFLEHALAHFAVEDALMERVGYPQRRSHLKIHENLIAQAKDLARRLHSGELGITQPVLDFLECWLVHHMQEEDLPLAKFLKGEGH